MFRLIVGLFNDEKKYHLTFHNAGDWAVRALAERRGFKPSDSKWNLFYRSDVSPLLLATPHSYMNVSGPCVKEALLKAGGDPAALLVVSDDFMLPEGKLRIRRGGSSGGHNGLKSVIEALGTDQFPRLRIGVGPVPEGVDPADYVLRKVSAKRLEDLAAKGADALETCLEEGLEQAMNRFNP